LARELHDTVAHHLSGIVIQAQAGQAVAATDPQRALRVLGVIENEAARVLTEMRALVGVLRDGAEVEPGLHPNLRARRSMALPWQHFPGPTLRI
jgi:signal transduction histidine kinase